MTDVRVLLCTCPPAAAAELAEALLQRRLVACVNELRGVASRYRWQGQLRCEEESLLVLKTTADRVPALGAALDELHPYDTPELLSLPVESGAAAYVDWIREETAPHQTPEA